MLIPNGNENDENERTKQHWELVQGRPYSHYAYSTLGLNLSPYYKRTMIHFGPLLLHALVPFKAHNVAALVARSWKLAKNKRVFHSLPERWSALFSVQGLDKLQVQNFLVFKYFSFHFFFFFIWDDISWLNFRLGCGRWMICERGKKNQKGR